MTLDIEIQQVGGIGLNTQVYRLTESGLIKITQEGIEALTPLASK